MYDMGPEAVRCPDCTAWCSTFWGCSVPLGCPNRVVVCSVGHVPESPYPAPPCRRLSKRPLLPCVSSLWHSAAPHTTT